MVPDREYELAKIEFQKRYLGIYGMLQSAWVLGYLGRKAFRGWGRNTPAYKYYIKGKADKKAEANPAS
jgi:hypothetical protein